MPTFADKATLPKNLEISGKDVFPVSNTSRGKTGSRIEQVPAALVCDYSHAFLFNFNSASVFLDNRYATVTLTSFDGNQIIDNAAVIITKPFVGLGSSPVVDLGIHDLDTDGDGVPDNIVNGVALNALGAGTLNRGTGEAAEAVLCPNGDTLRATFDATTGSKLNTATAGQVVILVNIIDVNEYTDIIPAFD